MNLEEIIKTLQEQYNFDVEKLKSLLVKKEVDLYDLKINDEVWIIHKNTIIKKIVCSWGTCINEINEYIKNGNGFLTEQEAKIELQKRQVEFELKKYAFKPNWGDKEQEKWQIRYVSNEDKINCDSWYVAKYSFIYFENENILKKVIEEVGEKRIEAYLKGELYE